jgi:hypothetical protein
VKNTIRLEIGKWYKFESPREIIAFVYGESTEWMLLLWKDKNKFKYMGIRKNFERIEFHGPTTNEKHGAIKLILTQSPKEYYN